MGAWGVHYEMVEGYAMPAHFAGDPALELASTWSGWDRPPALGSPVDPRREYLADADRLAVWVGHVGLATPGEVRGWRADPALSGAPGARALREVRRLRLALYAVAAPEVPSGLPSRAEGFDAVAAAADAAARASRLWWDGARASRGVPDGGPVTLVHRVAAGLERLASSGDLAHVRACPGDDCGWLFLDPTGRRRWCSMTSCGNRAKVRSHARRR